MILPPKGHPSIQTQTNRKHLMTMSIFPPRSALREGDMLLQTTPRNEQLMMYALENLQKLSHHGSRKTRNNARQQPERIPAAHAQLLLAAPNVIALVPKQGGHAEIATLATNDATIPPLLIIIE
jgi:hypothetical protein